MKQSYNTTCATDETEMDTQGGDSVSKPSPVYPVLNSSANINYMRKTVTTPLLQVVTREIGCYIVSIEKKQS